MLDAQRKRGTFPQPMEFERPKYSQQEVDKAGRILASTPPNDSIEQAEAWDILNNWRAAHNWPLHIVSEELRRFTLSVEDINLVPYRIKRFPSILKKLSQRKGKITLSSMQDIGGCRAIVNSVDSIRKVVELCKSGIPGHKIIDENDYIANPKIQDGYRSHHLIVEFHSDDPEFADYNGMKTEIQIRSRYQHSWATAVETVDLFTGSTLKSGRGPRNWHRFFKLMSSYFADKEGTPMVWRAPPDIEQVKENIRTHCRRNATEAFLANCEMTVTWEFNKPEPTEPYYWLIKFDRLHTRTWSRSYRRDQGDQAFIDYAEWERRCNPENPIVLVSIESVDRLREAYPNYYMDVYKFLRELRSITGWEPLQDEWTFTQT